jgi:outer membrane protein TolC
MALENNRSLAMSALAVERSGLGVQRAKEEFNVRLRPSGLANRSDSDADWRYTMEAGRKLNWGTDVALSGTVRRYPGYLDEPWRSSVRAEIRQPLFRRFGKSVTGEGITAARERLLAARREWELKKTGLIVAVVQAFETIVRLEKQIASDESVALRLDRLSRLTRVRERQGRASRVDALRVELQQGRAAARLESCREQAYSARRDLAEILGRPPEQDFTLQAPPLLELELPEVKAAVETALKNRLDYAQAADDWRALRRGAGLARRGLLPDLSLTAWGEQFGRERDFGGSLGLGEHEWFVGVSGEIALPRSRERTELRQREIDAEVALEAVRLKALSITREVQQAASEYRRSRSDLGAAAKNYALAESRAELARRLFAKGRGDSFSAAEAEDAFIEAETSLLNARSAVSIAGYRLMDTLGVLVESGDDLKPKPPETEP